jgi:hypothetical protein
MPEGAVEVLVICTIVASAIIGAIMGRAYERNVWQQRLLDRAGMGQDHFRRLSETVSDIRSRAPSEPAQLSDAIDAIAIEVERIGESQRFLTKVLAERDRKGGVSGSSPIPGTVKTPTPRPA